MSERLTILVGDVLERLAELESESVHCVCTSPPYWALRDYGVSGQLGLEPVLDCLGWATGARCGACYICRMVQVFGGVKRVLRRDGVAFVNLGDSYAGNGSGSATAKEKTTGGGCANWTHPTEGRMERRPPVGLKPKDLCLVPARLALALQADGWYVRMDIIWHKPNPMPESVTDRPTKSHEYIWLLSRSERYYYDAEAVREPQSEPWRSTGAMESSGPKNLQTVEQGINGGFGLAGVHPRQYNPAGRNKRSVWTVPSESFPGLHFATYPRSLIRPCILAGTSERGGCPRCGKCWERVVEKAGEYQAHWKPGAQHKQAAIDGGRISGGVMETGMVSIQVTTGWRPGCTCFGRFEKRRTWVDFGDGRRVKTVLDYVPEGEQPEPQPCVVLDPFLGAGTTALVALEYNRQCIGIELNTEYADMARKRCAAIEAQGVLL